MAGAEGEVRVLQDGVAAGTHGKLRVNGEYWDFVSGRPVRVGERVRIACHRAGRLEIESLTESGG